MDSFFLSNFPLKINVRGTSSYVRNTNGMKLMLCLSDDNGMEWSNEMNKFKGKQWR